MDINNTHHDNSDYNLFYDLLPGFGSSVKFSSLSNSINLGDSRSQRMLKGINGLQMTLNLNYNNIKDDEANDLLGFLQSQFYYDPQNYSNDGSFTNKRIEPFDCQPFYPYKSNKFICLNYQHDKSYYNSNTVSATLSSVAGSILSSVEPGPIFNDVISAGFNFGSNGGGHVTNNSNDLSITLNNKNHIYQLDTYAARKVNESSVTIGPNAGSNVSVDDGYFPSVGENDWETQHTNMRNSIYIDSPNDCSYYPYEPKHNGGELECRMFDFRPNNQMSINSSPKYKASTASDVYKKFNKYGFNPNLNNLSLTFDARSDLEAKRILLFLESHLGYKKFGFHLQSDYPKKDSPSSNRGKTPHGSKLSYFYCPEWQHTFVYKDNHTIQATFIECLPY